MKWESAALACHHYVGLLEVHAEMPPTAQVFDGKQIIIPKSFELITSYHIVAGSGLAARFLTIFPARVWLGLSLALRTDPVKQNLRLLLAR